MFRRFIHIRTVIRQKNAEKISLLNRLRKHPILLACASSGFLYRSYFTRIQSRINQSEQLPILSKHLDSSNFIFYSTDSNSEGNYSQDIRMNRLLNLRESIEQDLPLIFEKKLLELPKKFLDQETIVYVESSSGSRYKLGNRHWANAGLIAVRAYFSTRSWYPRLELMNVLANTDKWELDVHFRVVLVPSPSFRETRLPSDKLLKQLEERAEWHDFRALFKISTSGEVSHVCITKFLPPQKPSERVKTLKQLALLKRLAPSMSGVRRLPTPTPVVVPFYSTDNFIDASKQLILSPPSDCSLQSVLSLSQLDTKFPSEPLPKDLAASTKSDSVELFSPLSILFPLDSASSTAAYLSLSCSKGSENQHLESALLSLMADIFLSTYLSQPNEDVHNDELSSVQSSSPGGGSVRNSSKQSIVRFAHDLSQTNALLSF